MFENEAFSNFYDSSVNMISKAKLPDTVLKGYLQTICAVLYIYTSFVKDTMIVESVCCRTLYIYHKPHTYKYNHKHSDLKVRYRTCTGVLLRCSPY